MRTRVCRVGADPESDPAVREAATLLRSGEVVAFPTETVYGLGADATSVAAVDRIFAVKERPPDNPVIVHVAAVADVEKLAEVPDRHILYVLAEAFWPGPLTVVLPARAMLQRSVGRGLNTAAFRVPAHPVARALIIRASLPLAAPSANLSGRPSPTTAQHVLDDLNGRVPLILDGGPCLVGIESTVLDLTEPTARILRPGLVTASELAMVLGDRFTDDADNAALLRSPGTRYRHYSPSVPLVVLEAAVTDAALNTVLELLLATATKVAYMGHRRNACEHPVVVHSIQRDHSAVERARHLYDDLRNLDRPTVDLIIADGIVAAGLGIGVMERLRRAATLIGTTSQEIGEVSWLDRLNSLARVGRGE